MCPERAGPIWRGVSLSYALLHEFINGTSPCATRWRPSTARSARRGDTGGEACEALLRGEGPQPRSAALAGRLVRVLAELDLVDLDREGPALRAVEAPERTALERSAAFRAYHRRLEDGLRYLSSAPIRAAA